MQDSFTIRSRHFKYERWLSIRKGNIFNGSYRKRAARFSRPSPTTRLQADRPLREGAGDSLGIFSLSNDRRRTAALREPDPSRNSPSSSPGPATPRMETDSTPLRPGERGRSPYLELAPAPEEKEGGGAQVKVQTHKLGPGSRISALLVFCSEDRQEALQWALPFCTANIKTRIFRTWKKKRCEAVGCLIQRYITCKCNLWQRQNKVLRCYKNVI